MERPSSSKSISISGRLTLSGFKNLSKSKLYLIGSRFVIPRQYATAEPAADPLPGPTETFISLAAEIKSWTIRKYPGYPVLDITFNSKSNLSEISLDIFGYLFFAPS